MAELETKTPAEQKIYGIDWTTKIHPATITDSDWDIPDGITAMSHNFAEQLTLVKLDGGTLTEDYTLTNTIVTSDSEQFQAAIVIRVRAAS